MIEPFRVEVSSETIMDLRDRLRATRWPGGVSDSGGVPLSEMRDIARYWLEEFDWPAREHDINRLPHFRAELGGLRLHYIHMKSARPDARPLLLLHGWPGSFVEMLSIVPMLTESFHVWFRRCQAMAFPTRRRRLGCRMNVSQRFSPS
jgi:Epoxide hydrolase N terminus.